MSMEITVYIEDFNDITREGCEKYLENFGIRAQIDPEANFQVSTGFLPIKVEFPFIEQLSEKEFISGFEMFQDTFSYEQELQEINESQDHCANKFTHTTCLNKAANSQTAETPSGDKVFIADSDIDAVLIRCRYRLDMYYHNMDELVLALAVASYLAETRNGVVHDPQTGDYYYFDIKQRLSEYIEEALDSIELDGLHPFEDWA